MSTYNLGFHGEQRKIAYKIIIQFESYLCICYNIPGTAVGGGVTIVPKLPDLPTLPGTSSAGSLAGSTAPILTRSIKCIAIQNSSQLSLPSLS